MENIPKILEQLIQSAQIVKEIKFRTDYPYAKGLPKTVGLCAVE